MFKITKFDHKTDFQWDEIIVPYHCEKYPENKEWTYFWTNANDNHGTVCEGTLNHLFAEIIIR